MQRPSLPRMLASVFLSLALAIPASAQRVDTLAVQSSAFAGSRTVYVHVPEGYEYVGSEAALPVIIVLDGQHEWFATPVVATVAGMSFTKELPWVLTVVVPHEDRVQESAIRPDSGTQMPLLTFLADELPRALAAYRASDLRLLIGHSFTASFALHALAKRPDAFSAVMAHTPLDRVTETVPAVLALLRQRPDRAAMISLGGEEWWADSFHHRVLSPLLASVPTDAVPSNFRFLEAPRARHNAVPIRTTAELLSWYFAPFADRDSLVRVDANYQLVEPPPTANELLQRIDASLSFRGATIPWQLPDLAGLASRLATGENREQLIAVYRRGTELYPNYFWFHASLAELLSEHDGTEARRHFTEALRLLDEFEREEPDYLEVRAELLARLR